MIVWGARTGMKMWDLKMDGENFACYGYTKLLGLSPDFKSMLCDKGIFDILDVAKRTLVCSLPKFCNGDENQNQVYVVKALGPFIDFDSGKISKLNAATCQSFVTGSEDTNIAIWNLQSGEKKLTLEGHTNPVCCLAFTPDGKSLVSAEGQIMMSVLVSGYGILKKE